MPNFKIPLELKGNRRELRLVFLQANKVHRSNLRIKNILRFLKSINNLHNHYTKTNDDATATFTEDRLIEKTSQIYLDEI